MDPIEIPPLDFAVVVELCTGKGLVLSQASPTTITVTRDSMVSLFPDSGEEYDEATVKLLREATPEIYWRANGKTDDVGFFTAYPLPQS